MLSYAIDRRPSQRLHPTTLALIVGGHALALLAVMTARGDIVQKWVPVGTEVTLIDPAPPPPPPPEPNPAPDQPVKSTVTQTVPLVPIPSPIPAIPLDLGPPTLAVTPVPGTGAKPADPAPPTLPIVPPGRGAARAITASADLLPPYPEVKRRLGEEASLRLKLEIDPRGRVTGVEPIGAADADFLESARRHIVRRWRYKPATEDGRAVASTLTVTVRFEIDR